MRRSPKPGSNLPLVFMVVIVVIMAVVVGFILGNWMLGYLLGPSEMETVSYGPLLHEENRIVLDEPTEDEPTEDEEYLREEEMREIALGGEFLVQLGAFGEIANARNLVDELKSKGYSAFMTDESPYRVQVGMFRTRDEAVAMGEKLKSDGYEVFILR